jgi:hypothetical protein
LQKTEKIREVYDHMEAMKKQKISELKVKLEQPFREKEKKPKKAKSRMDPIKHILQTNNRAFNLSDRMNTKLVQICNRCDLDRPILMRDKLDLIWNNN